MMRILVVLVTFLLTGVCLLSCQENNDQNLPPFEDRVDQAIGDVREELTAPENGWKLFYQPEPTSGIFFTLIKFNEDGSAFVKSDVIDDNGEAFDDTITYRIDANLGIELILESFTSFHFLFEQNAASFGAEFEFIYDEKDGNNLIFYSKTDLPFERTELVFIPAETSDLAIVAPEINKNLALYDFEHPNINIGLGVPGSQQHVVFKERDMSVFWEIDVTRRLLRVSYASKGTTIEEVIASNSSTVINQTIGYYIINGQMIFVNPLNFTLDGENHSISGISLGDVSMDNVAYCAGESVESPVYAGSVDGLGNIDIEKTLFSGSGLGFVEDTANAYSVNVFFIFGDTVGSLLNDGVINENFPEATGFVFNYGLDTDTTGVPSYAIGLIVQDENDINRTILREIEPTSTVGNRVDFTFKPDVYVSNDKQESDSTGILAVTDEIFTGGSIYAYDEPLLDGLRLFRLYNPCNNYEFFLVGL